MKLKLQGTMRVNEKGHLEIGGVDVLELVQNFGTPLWVLDEVAFRENCRAFKEAFQSRGEAEVIYASKALCSQAVLLMVKEEGLGLDVVSGGELYTAISVGFPMEKVYFHGNNKSPAELRMALEAGCGCIVVDNFHEISLIKNICAELGKRQRVMLRVSPGIEAHTHDYIKTGQLDSKFGFTLSNGQALAAVKLVAGIPELDYIGLHCHIGSQIFEMQSFSHAAEVMVEFMAEVEEATKMVTRELNLGGGFGIYYTASDSPRLPQDWAQAVMPVVKEATAKRGMAMPKIIVEPGRAIVGPAGTTLYTVGSIKDIPGVRKYVAVDGGMGDNPRPALYGSKYEAVVANKANMVPQEKVSIAGKCCESGDMLIWDIELPKIEPGDILAVSCTGAYNYAMSMNYNRLPRPAMVLVREGMAELILKRETYEDLIRNDVVPSRLNSPQV